MNAQRLEGADTRTPLHRPGDWTGSIGHEAADFQFRQASWDKDGQHFEGVGCTIYFYTDDPKDVGEGGAPPARVRWQSLLEKTSSGGLAMGKASNGMQQNKQLGYLLTALGFQTKEGQNLKPWSFEQMKGMRLKYRVAHEPRKDTGEPVAEVVSVAPAV
jgi:hypothetical protein